ncbi:hypothetical protein QBC39DRAFT_343390 [Podospora conica]|nr:hypothetical protein QBC39DRAFT_343390 [Schizothecium conicum]
MRSLTTGSHQYPPAVHPSITGSHPMGAPDWGMDETNQDLVHRSHHPTCRSPPPSATALFMAFHTRGYVAPAFLSLHSLFRRRSMRTPSGRRHRNHLHPLQPLASGTLSSSLELHPTQHPPQRRQKWMFPLKCTLRACGDSNPEGRKAPRLVTFGPTYRDRPTRLDRSRRWSHRPPGTPSRALASRQLPPWLEPGFPCPWVGCCFLIFSSRVVLICQPRVSRFHHSTFLLSVPRRSQSVRLSVSLRHLHLHAAPPTVGCEYFPFVVPFLLVSPDAGPRPGPLYPSRLACSLQKKLVVLRLVALFYFVTLPSDLFSFTAWFALGSFLSCRGSHSFRRQKLGHAICTAVMLWAIEARKLLLCKKHATTSIYDTRAGYDRKWEFDGTWKKQEVQDGARTSASENTHLQ